MKYLIPSLIVILFFSCSNKKPEKGSAHPVVFEEATYQDRPHIRVKTKQLTYWFDIRGGGFSRIVDSQENDWISFKMEPWGVYPDGAASAFRGLPNLVYQLEDNGAGHPGWDMCTSEVDGNRIVTESLSGLWKWSWEFFDDHAILDVLKTDPSRAYWFLYEGTPGGSYNPSESYFGTPAGGPEPGGYDFYKGDILWGNFQWMYTGTTGAPGTFYMVQVEPDTLQDMVSFLGNTDQGLSSPDGMTVFGFGRGKETNPLMTGSQQFVIGLYDSPIRTEEDHQKIETYIHTNFIK